MVEVPFVEPLSGDVHAPRSVLSVLFFSRGRGRGHAIPDIEIGRMLRSIRSGIDIKYVSYSLGADTFRAQGFDVIDLQLPDSPDPWDLLFKQLRLVSHVKPALVIAHEEPQALFAADVFNTPSVFVTDFFLDPTNHWMQPLKLAADVIFIGHEGEFTEPPYLRGRVHYVGPAVRKMHDGTAARARFRSRYFGEACGEDAVLVVCQPGNHDEASTSLSERLLDAWSRLPYRTKHLVWIAGRDYDLINERSSRHRDVTVLREEWDIEGLFAAADLLITKGNRISVYEAAAVGLPSISFSDGANWPDEVAIAKVRSNRMLNARTISAAEFSDWIMRGLSDGREPIANRPTWTGIEQAAMRISDTIRRMNTSTEKAKEEARHAIE